MRLPFTVEEFFDVFRRYNEAVWPAQWVLLLSALVAVLVAARTQRPTRLPLVILAILWLWIGVVYHLLFFRSINPAAALFGALFIIQAGVFAWVAIRRPMAHFVVQRDTPSLLGGLTILLALVIYPSLGWLAGHRYPAAPTFGLPCPTTVFTFGLLLWNRSVLPRRVLIIPVLWSLIATSAAFQLGVMEDLSLPLAAMIACAVLLRGERRIEGFRPAQGRT